MDSTTTKTLTVTHETIKLATALKRQLEINSELREELFQAARIIEQLTKELEKSLESKNS